jgi:hypothetical protein
MNRKLNRDVETVFLMTGLRWIFTSSSIIKEAARFGGDVSDMVPPGSQPPHQSQISVLGHGPVATSDFLQGTRFKKFSRAGRAVHLSQPTVSSHIKDLEDHFDAGSSTAWPRRPCRPGPDACSTAMPNE